MNVYAVHEYDEENLYVSTLGIYSSINKAREALDNYVEATGIKITQLDILEFELDGED